MCNPATGLCDCASGYTKVNNVCTAGSSGPPNYSTDFTVTEGPGVISFPGGTVLAVTGAGETYIKYSRSHSYTVIDPAYTRVKVESLATTNQGFGVGFRYFPLPPSTFCIPPSFPALFLPLPFPSLIPFSTLPSHFLYSFSIPFPYAFPSPSFLHSFSLCVWPLTRLVCGIAE